MFMDGNVQLKDFSDDVLRALHRQCAAALEQIGSMRFFRRSDFLLMRKTVSLTIWTMNRRWKIIRRTSLTNS